MKIIIHIGMHKTGSSSIQDTFSRLKLPDIEYIDWASGNHSGLFVLLFEDDNKLPEYHGFKARGAEFAKTLPSLRAKWHAAVSAQIAGVDNKTIIFSAEDASARQFDSLKRRMRDFFAGWSDDISVIGYARAPAGFMASAFQQRLKGIFVPSKALDGVRPEYKARFQRIDEVFGRDRVTLREFTPSRLLNGDVVQDFAQQIGVAPLSQNQIVRANESLSLEAVALLYVQRHMGQGYIAGFDGAQKANNIFISKLASIGSRKFAFSKRMLAPALDEMREDIEWMENRLGHEFSESSRSAKDAISSMDDLVDVAITKFDAVQELLEGNVAAGGPATLENLVRLLERLREQCYAATISRNVAGFARNNIPMKRGAKTMATKTPVSAEKPKASEEQIRVRNKVANILWHVDHKDDLPADLDERKAAYALVKSEYVKKAGAFIQRLDNNNLSMVEVKENA